MTIKKNGCSSLAATVGGGLLGITVDWITNRAVGIDPARAGSLQKMATPGGGVAELWLDLRAAVWTRKVPNPHQLPAISVRDCAIRRKTALVRATGAARCVSVSLGGMGYTIGD
jgi:hypothetical protein